MILSCNSGGYRFQRCAVRGVRIYRAELYRQNSSAACVLGRTWGFDSRSVWVDRGCKADIIATIGR